MEQHGAWTMYDLCCEFLQCETVLSVMLCGGTSPGGMFGTYPEILLKLNVYFHTGYNFYGMQEYSTLKYTILLFYADMSI